MKRFSIAVSLVVLAWGCDGGSRPTSPSALSVPTRPTSTLSGMVFAVTPSGLAVVDGARVRLEIGSFRLDATTDQNGLYTLSGLYDGLSSVSTSKDGYDLDTRDGHPSKASTSTVMRAVQSSVTPGCSPTRMESIAFRGRITVPILS